MSRHKPRSLSPEEKRLWSKVTASANPIDRKLAKPIDPAKLLNSKPKTSVPQPIAPFSLGQSVSSKPVTLNLTPTLNEQLAAPAVAMDKKSFARLKRGKLTPESRIDLHGMTLEQAHPALRNFILRSHAEGKRLVLVITGRGKPRDDGGPIPTPFGVLRHQIPQWLKQAPLAPMVLQVVQANQRHGGSGAYYVYLKRQR